MKKKILVLSLLLVAAISFSFSYSNPRHKKSAKFPPCDCKQVTVLGGMHHGTNSTVTWTAPTGGDAVSSYSYGGYNSCGGAPFSGTTTNTSVEVPNPNQCSGTTITVTTNCTNGCRSSGNTLFF